MQWADQCSLPEDSIRERSAPMRTSGLCCEDRAVAAAKDRNREASYFENSALSERNALDAT
jgi:hypothetical protein